MRNVAYVVDLTDNTLSHDICIFASHKVTRPDLARLAGFVIDGVEKELAGLLFLSRDSSFRPGEEPAGFPTLPPDLAAVNDDMSFGTVGMNFLDLEANTPWTAAGKTYLQHRCDDKSLTSIHFVQSDGRPNMIAIGLYLDNTRVFLEKLTAAIHITAGQPARSMELLSV
ncbi:hypothetical protein CGLO_00635 [Colletotrichum gloeosporioides Cg-14]|uniref:Uncharacterized protein n=1 Tax=Colletotrichum gloeosporioides (strain Cg-14) TaxID=1237896 RepID=T0M6G1_COLGC|nr:hypothetical protein CGLO_00635 [Colletotrichum gloeosporioides Cg-14]